MKLFRYDMSKRIASVEDRKIFVNSRCWLCNREKESPEHMIFNCDALAVKRADTLGGPTQLTTCFRIHQISRPHEPFLKVILWIWIHPLSKRMALGSLGQALSPSGVGPRTEKNTFLPNHLLFCPIRKRGFWSHSILLYACGCHTFQ